MFRRKNKRLGKRTTSKSGSFRSGFEKIIANLLSNKKVKFEYEPYKIPYTVQSTYTPDFVVGDIIIEAKGLFDAPTRKKMKAVKECNPDLDIRFWFMRDNYLNNKTKKTKYSDWAKKHSFPFHIGETFPEHWFKKKRIKKK